jgi:hypothetical protein
MNIPVDKGRKNNISKISFPQEPLWKETLLALQKAQSIDILTDARALANILHFNSEETRSRYGQAIATRFSRLDSQVLASFFNIAKSGLDVKIIDSIWRILFCMVEPTVARTYLDIIWPREPGAVIHRMEIRNYIDSTFQQQSKKLNNRITNCLHYAGYIIPQGKDTLIIVGFGDIETPLIISTYLLYAQNPRTIKISEIEESHFWKYLGFRKFDHVRLGFRSAESKGLLMRYASVDHLEQITTRYSWQELISNWNKINETQRI